MRAGNRKESVRELESVSAVCSWQSDLGGEVLLELAMALETVERGEEARKVYGKVRRGGAFFHPSLAKHIRHLIISPPPPHTARHRVVVPVRAPQRAVPHAGPGHGQADSAGRVAATACGGYAVAVPGVYHKLHFILFFSS